MEAPREEDVEDFAEYVEALLEESNSTLRRSQTFHAFLESVTARRMSKEGMFFRLHFLTGARVDVVPTGSLARGFQRKDSRWQLVEPTVKQLWQEFHTLGQEMEEGR